MYEARTARRVTIIVDAGLLDHFLEKLVELGAKGYNLVKCHGQGIHAVTGDPFTGDDLIRIELITSEPVAAKVLDYIHATQFSQFGRYALTAYADHVEVDSRDKSLG